MSPSRNNPCVPEMTTYKEEIVDAFDKKERMGERKRERKIHTERERKKDTERQRERERAREHKAKKQ